jgi:hypothetical protein
MKQLSCLVTLLCLAALSVSAQVEVTDMKFGTGVEHHECVGEASAFPASTERVYCWMRVTGADGKTLNVKWYLNDNLISEVPLEVKYNPTRTYSSKAIAGNKGAWRVEVYDDTNKMIKSGTFETN